MRKMVQSINIKGKEIILVGTAHISKKSIQDVEDTIRTEKPDKVCIEIDKTRYKTIVKKNAWQSLNISKVLKEKKGFLLLANIVLSSFQKRLGLDVGVRPGEEMIKAIKVAEELGIDCVFCDREVQITLKRAWSHSSFWGKNKMLAALLSAVFSKEKISEKEMEKLKEKSLMHNMLEELSSFLPAAKEVLIDERDRYLATKIFNTKAKKLVAVVGAGHIDGIIKYLKLLSKKELKNDVSDLEHIPPKGIISKVLPWLIPVLVLGLIVIGFILRGPQTSINMVVAWFLANGISSAVGTLLAWGHPFSVLASFLGAPITSLNPLIGAGMVTGLVQYNIRKPRVLDFEKIQNDFNSIKGFYKNRILHILLVSLLSSLGSVVGTWVGLANIISQF